MSARASVILITVGAILALAVRAQPSFLDLHVVGLILITVGLIRPAVAGVSSLAPRAARHREVVEVVDEPIEEPAPSAPASRTAPVRRSLPARHPLRSPSRTS